MSSVADCLKLHLVTVGTENILKKEGFLLLQEQQFVSDISLRQKIIAKPTYRTVQTVTGCKFRVCKSVHHHTFK